MDDYTLAILPLAHLLGEEEVIARYCARAGADLAACHGVLQAGLLGYRLYTWHGLVRARFGADIEQQVCKRHIRIFDHGNDLGPVLAMIDDAVGIGALNTPTARGVVSSPVELNVALALLLGVPGSPHYVGSPEQRRLQIAQMKSGIDWCFADCLARGRQEMVRDFMALIRLPGRAGQRRKYWI